MSENDKRRLAAVTGITGFVGGHLAGALARRGWRIRALVRSMPRFDAIPGPAIEVVQGSLADSEALGRLVEGADAVIHLAGAIKGRGRADFLRANAAGTARLVEAWRDHGFVSHFVYLSSMAARVPELSQYAASKSAAEAELSRIDADAPWSILRPAAIYGPGDRETLRIFRTANGPVQPMLNDAEARVTAVHVDDVTNAIIALADRPISGRVFELTDGNYSGYSWRQLTSEAARALGRGPRTVKLPNFAVRALGLAGDAVGVAGGEAMLTTPKAREILHPDWGSDPADQPPPELWQPKTSLSEGFAQTVAWYREHGWL
ncbi:MAG: NAD-dependent epimerase/dehydratase family protein [Paracoccaceae bacterium]|nr:NAD-dependent epimerase/dehydratase family protein [Paracoccaceae bacterium]